MSEIADTVRQYILREFLPDTDAAELTDTLELIDNNILHSLARLRLRAYLEEEFDVELEIHELDFEHFGTIADIEQLVQSKLG